MNYRDLLKRYSENKVSKEEKILIEDELSKHEAFEEFITEKFDNDFGEKFDFNEDEKETIGLKKRVNRKLKGIIIKSVLIIILLYIGIFYGLSGLMNYIYYNPSATTQSVKQKYNNSDFEYDIQAYISLNMPGSTSGTFAFEESKGFGNYRVSYDIKDLFTKEENIHFVDINRGKISSAIDGVFSWQNRFNLWNGFEKIQYKSLNKLDEDGEYIHKIEDDRNNKITSDTLNKINPISYVSMNIMFNEDISMEEFYRMKKQNPEIRFKWVGVRTSIPGTFWSENQITHLIGFNPYYNDEPSSNREPNKEKYPYFYFDPFDLDLGNIYSDEEYDKAIAKAYENHFYSRLKYISQREEFIKMFDYNRFKIDFYKNAIKYVDENGIKSYGVLVYGTAENLIKYIEKIDYDTIYINKVLPIKPDIYYN